MNADPFDTGRIKSFDKILGQLFHFRRHLREARQKIGERLVRLLEVDSTDDFFHFLPEAFQLGQFRIAPDPMAVDDRLNGQVSALHELTQFRRFAMNEFRAQLHGYSGAARHGVDSSAATLARLQQYNLYACGGKFSSCGKPGCASSDDDNSSLA